MVVLEFQPNEAAIAEERAADLALVDAASLQETYFILPVRLRVDAVELLEVAETGEERVWTNAPHEGGLIPTYRRRISSPWLSLPLLNVATVGLAKVIEAHQQGASTYSLPGFGWYLQFASEGTQIRIYSQVNNRTAFGDCGELLRAFKDFSSYVRQFLVREAPELNDHPGWGSWFAAMG